MNATDTATVTPAADACEHDSANGHQMHGSPYTLMACIDCGEVVKVYVDCTTCKGAGGLPVPTTGYFNSSVVCTACEGMGEVEWVGDLATIPADLLPFSV